MVLESLIRADDLIKHPIKMIAISFIVSLICSFVAYFIFPSFSGVISPLLITVAMAPIIYTVFSKEEELEEKQAKHLINQNIVDRYDELIKIFMWFFIGNMLAILLMTAVLPDSILSVIFSQQIGEISAISNLANSATGQAISGDFLSIIIVNNLKVMAFSFILAFLIETGGLLILSWNA